MSFESDVQLERVRSFDQFFAEQFQPLVRYVYAYTADSAVAEDLASEAFAAAWRDWSNVSTMERPDRWLRTVLRHKHTDSLRRKYSQRRALARLGRYDDTAQAVELPDDELTKAVASLSRRQGQVIALMYFEDRSADEVAAVLEIKVDDVYKHHNRAKARLRQIIGEKA